MHHIIIQNSCDRGLYDDADHVATYESPTIPRRGEQVSLVTAMGELQRFLVNDVEHEIVESTEGMDMHSCTWVYVTELSTPG
jgi:hypothetical protein